MIGQGLWKEKIIFIFNKTDVYGCVLQISNALLYTKWYKLKWAF